MKNSRTKFDSLSSSLPRTDLACESVNTDRDCEGTHYREYRTFGIPVSTTHAKTTAIMGVGAVKRLSAINFGVVKEMGMTWLLTFPGCGLLGFITTQIFMKIF